LQELFLQEVAGRAHEVMLQDEQRKGNTLDYKDVGELQCKTAFCQQAGTVGMA
jgi:hypothetical protein